MSVPAWADLAKSEDEPDFMPLAMEFIASKRSFILHVPSWRNYLPLQKLVWKKVKYASQKKVVSKRGVYAFVVDSKTLLPGFFPPHSFILYIGETGNTSNSTLQTRLKNYRNPKNQKKRAHVWPMLHTWGDNLYFYYAEVSSKIDTKDCEQALLDALLPPLNMKDFSGVVNKARKHAFST